MALVFVVSAAFPFHVSPATNVYIRRELLLLLLHPNSENTHPASEHRRIRKTLDVVPLLVDKTANRDSRGPALKTKYADLYATRAWPLGLASRDSLGLHLASATICGHHAANESSFKRRRADAK